MSRHTTFCFTLRPTAEQEQALWRHAGAARFAYNQCLRMVVDGLEAKKDQPDRRVPWSGFDLINAINSWKRSEAAGTDEQGKPGLSWRGEVCQQVFEEAAVDLGRALEAFSKSRRGKRRGKKVRFPRFKKRASSRPSFRLRNKTTKARSMIRLGEGEARTVRLPKLGVLRVREDTRKLRRMLAKGRAKVLFATVSRRASGHWRVSLNVEAADLHPARRHRDAERAEAVGIDRGLSTFAVVAEASGRQLERLDSPRPLRAALPKLRRASRALSRKKLGSRNRSRAKVRLAKLHQRIGNVRRDFVHRESSRLAKTHGRLVLEDLCTIGLMRTNLARSLADSAWALFAQKLTYKVAWYGGQLTLADRFFPSTRRCSACGDIGDALPLSKRTFRCRRCGHEADRDTNAAACLGQYPDLAWPHVAGKHPETPNVCGEESAGAQARPARETGLGEAERAPARRPRRAVSTETVDTL